jgi:hypothetical protein
LKKWCICRNLWLEPPGELQFLWKMDGCSSISRWKLFWKGLQCTRYFIVKLQRHCTVPLLLPMKSDPTNPHCTPHYDHHGIVTYLIGEKWQEICKFVWSHCNASVENVSQLANIKCLWCAPQQIYANDTWKITSSTQIAA